MYAFLLLFFFFFSAAGGATFTLDIHHRFSDTVRRWSQLPPSPPRLSIDYYAALAAHDRALRGRELSEENYSQLTFAEGNATARIDSLGFLHYAMVSVGTPSVTFMVALDTGSDLFWVPCDCRQCAPTTPAGYGYEFEFRIYSPNMSATSHRVPCNSRLCDFQNECTVGSHCDYKIAYVSADTSSSGILVEDVLYLATENLHRKVVEARIIFGCGQVQTGSFLDVAAPNGLFGLGMEKISVPSMLASAGLTSDSFSMCFGHDGVGRISFGDKGSLDQEETPFGPSQRHPTYNITVTGINIGNSSADSEYGALFDSGTSFTYLTDPAYTSLSEIFDAQVQNKRHAADPRIPFEYCYDMSSNSTQIPSVTLTMKGGSKFRVSDPIIVITIQQHEAIYCLAVVKSNNLNIIGQNFMTGLRVVFDRERMILGWKDFNCYDVQESSYLPISPKSSFALPPNVARGPSNYNPEATKENRNNTQITVSTPPLSYSHRINCSLDRILMVIYILIFLAIL